MLLHIHRIDCCEAYHLASAIVLPETASVLLREPMPWKQLPMVGLATLETSEDSPPRSAAVVSPCPCARWPTASLA